MEFNSKDALHAKHAIREYKKNAGTAPDGKSNTRGVWFSIEQLSEMLENLKQERIYSYALASKIERETGEGIIDGVRVYFATYPEGYQYVDKDHVGRNTVFFISTKGGFIRDETQPDPTVGEKFHQDEFHRETGLDPYVDPLGFKRTLILTLDPENTGELSPPKIKGVDNDLLPFN